MRGLLIAQQPGTQTVISAPTRRAASDGSTKFDDANSCYREERIARFRRCCRFRSFHLVFCLLLSFARAALVHLNAIGRSLAAVSERPDPPGREAQGGPGLATNGRGAEVDDCKVVFMLFHGNG